MHAVRGFALFSVLGITFKVFFIAMNTRAEEADVIDTIFLSVCICHGIVVTLHSGTKTELILQCGKVELYHFVVKGIGCNVVNRKVSEIGKVGIFAFRSFEDLRDRMPESWIDGLPYDNAPVAAGCIQLITAYRNFRCGLGVQHIKRHGGEIQSVQTENTVRYGEEVQYIVETKLQIGDIICCM